jgi:hypothetical protein
MKTGGLAFLKSNGIRNISRFFNGPGGVLSKLLPHMELALKQSGIAEDYELTTRQYFAIALLHNS